MAVLVHETATVEKGSIIGEGCKIWHYAHVREGATLGKNCNVGHCAYVGKDVKIGDNAKIGNKASIFQGVRIGKNVFIGPHVTFTNDIRPRSVGNWEITKCNVKDGASVGANSTVLCGITIGENSMVGAGSVVTKDVPGHGLVYGNPAKLKGFVCSCGADVELAINKGSDVLLKCKDCKKELTVSEEIYKKLGD